MSSRSQLFQWIQAQEDFQNSLTNFLKNLDLSKYSVFRRTNDAAHTSMSVHQVEFYIENKIYDSNTSRAKHFFYLTFE